MPATNTATALQQYVAKIAAAAPELTTAQKSLLSALIGGAA